MKRISLTSNNQSGALQEAVDTLSKGGLVVFPTETMYGVAADATSAEAVTRLLQYKNRPAGKPIAVLVSNSEQATLYVELNTVAENLYTTFLPGPVTVISSSKGKVDPRLESEFGTLGIRISSHPVAQGLAEAFGKPVSATSANASGTARPYSIDGLLKGLSEKQQELISLILDAGELPHNEPSTVIDTTQAVQEVLRSGEYLSELYPPHYSQSEEATIAIAAELLETLRHVLPEKPIILALQGEMGAGKTHFTKGIAQQLGISEVITSPTYTLMKEYENSGTKLIHIDCWRVPEISAQELELERYLQPQTVIVIEWPTPLLSYLKDQKENVVSLLIDFQIESATDRCIRIGSI